MLLWITFVLVNEQISYVYIDRLNVYLYLFLNQEFEFMKNQKRRKFCESQQIKLSLIDLKT